METSDPTKLVIPEGVTEITKHIKFQQPDIEAITEVHIPDSVTRIGDYAFSGCSGLTEIVIPEGVISIGVDAFQRCTKLKEIHIPASVTEIETRFDSGLEGCVELIRLSVSPENKVYDSRNNCNAIIETASNKLLYGCNNGHSRRCNDY